MTTVNSNETQTADPLKRKDPDPSPAIESTESNSLEGSKISDAGNYDEIGQLTLLQRPDVDVGLTLSRERPIAGELWSVSGEIHNRSKTTAWIIDTKSVLTLAPEMWGQTSQRGSIPAFFPTIHSRQGDEVVRIDPGAKYVVIWKVNTLELKQDANSARQIFRRIGSALKDFTFFNPGRFVISSTVHVWSSPPLINSAGNVSNLGTSFPISVTKEVEMEASPWVLIFGAAVGGILCFLLQLLFGRIPTGSSGGEIAKTIILGLFTTTLLSGVATVLISRLAKADFLLVVKVNDLWGAITTGFVIQWFGYEALTALVPNITAAPG